MVARGKGGTTTGKPRWMAQHPGEGCQSLGDMTAATRRRQPGPSLGVTRPALLTASTWDQSRAGSALTSLAPLPGCRSSPALLPGGRRPRNPRRPPATLWQPFGLTAPECPNPSAVRRIAGFQPLAQSPARLKVFSDGGTHRVSSRQWRIEWRPPPQRAGGVYWWKVLVGCPARNLCIGQGTHSSSRIFMRRHGPEAPTPNVPGRDRRLRGSRTGSTPGIHQEHSCLPGNRTASSRARGFP